MKTSDYLAALRLKLRTAEKPATDYRLAKALRISTQVMANYSSGRNIPGPVVAFRIAEILGDQPAAVIADLEAERAERDGKTEDADYLRGMLKKLGGAAASILLAVGFGGFPNGDGTLAHSADRSSVYASYRRRGWWGGSLPA